MIEYCELPSRTIMMSKVLEVIEKSDGEISTNDINVKVKEELNISDQDFLARTDDDSTTIFAYRMCWLRSQLKSEGKIESPRRGYWRIVKR